MSAGAADGTAHKHTDSRVKACIDAFFEAFKARFGVAYAVRGGPDGTAIKRFLGRQQRADDPDPVTSFKKHLPDHFNDPWCVEKRAWGIAFYANNFHRYAAVAPKRGQQATLEEILAKRKAESEHAAATTKP